MDNDLPGENQPKPDLPTLREELSFACREAVRRMKLDRKERRGILLEAWEIMLRPERYDAFQRRCAEVLLRAVVECGANFNHIDEGLTTSLAFLKTPTEPDGGKILVTS